MHSSEIQHAVQELISEGQPFDVSEIKDLVEMMLGDGNNDYHDPVLEPDVKQFLIKMFETGAMPGYCLSLKPMVGKSGPFVTFEFKLENPFTTVDLIGKPDEPQPVHCHIHPYFKELIKEVSKHAKCSQNQMVRSILIKSLMMIRDQVR